MTEYRLSKAADRDLDEIYAYSFREFGEVRALAYLQSLDNCLQLLAAQPQLGVDVSSVRKDYFRFTHQRHAIYFKLSSNGIFVVRVLGPGMSAERNLP